jgi:hypothetical protein
MPFQVPRGGSLAGLLLALVEWADSWVVGGYGCDNGPWTWTGDFVAGTPRAGPVRTRARSVATIGEARSEAEG